MTISERMAWLGLAFCLCAACAVPPPPGSDAGADVGVDPEPDSGPVDPDVAEARPAVELKVITFNAGRFFDTVCDSGNCEGDAYERQFSQTEFDYKVEQLAGGLEGKGADAILMQEVEKRECLEALAAALPGYSVADFGEIGGTATLDVGVLVRDTVEVVETRKHRATTALELSNGDTRQFARDRRAMASMLPGMGIHSSGDLMKASLS